MTEETTTEEKLLTTAGIWFLLEDYGNDVVRITEPHVEEFVRSNAWFIKGRDLDVLIDCGTGIASMKKHIPAIFKRKPWLVMTHTHFDHIGSHHEFKHRLVHSAEADVLTSPTAENTLSKDYIDADLIAALPHKGYEITDYAIEAAAPSETVEDGDVIDLGDRTLEVVHLPGHTPGSIGLWDVENGLLFSGDAIYDGQILDDLPNSNVDDYVRAMRRLREIPVFAVHPGHGESFGQRRLVELADHYLEARGGAPPAESAAQADAQPVARAAEWRQ